MQGLPEFHPFPVAVQVMGEDGSEVQEWRGYAWQVVVSKMRTYAGSVDIAPGAFMDDGLLNVCIMTADNPVRSLSLVFSFLVQQNSSTKGENENVWRDNLLGKRQYRVVVMGAIPHPTKKGTCIIAGSHKKQRSGRTEIVAVLVDDHTRVLRQEGEMEPSPPMIEGLQEGVALLVEENKNKHNIIRARSVRLA